MTQPLNQTLEPWDVIIVGGGAAGLNAALVLGRCRRRVLVCDAGNPRNAAARHAHGFLTRDGSEPLEILKTGREEIARYQVEYRNVTVADVQLDASRPVVVLHTGERFSARKLLLATGVTDCLPNISNIREFYGVSVHHCPYCDGWENQGKPLAVYGQAKPALGLALSLLTWTRDLVICTDGQPSPNQHQMRQLRRHRIGLRVEKIVRLEGAAGRLERIIFADGPSLERYAMFFNTGQVQRSPLAEQLGCRFDAKGFAICDRRGRTGVPNVFLAGDANGEVQFVIAAAAEGAAAAVAINRELQEEDRANLSTSS